MILHLKAFPCDAMTMSAIHINSNLASSKVSNFSLLWSPAWKRPPLLRLKLFWQSCSGTANLVKHAKSLRCLTHQLDNLAIETNKFAELVENPAIPHIGTGLDNFIENIIENITNALTHLSYDFLFTRALAARDEH
jgi:hypothetical protein